MWWLAMICQRDARGHGLSRGQGPEARAGTKPGPQEGDWEGRDTQAHPDTQTHTGTHSVPGAPSVVTTVGLCEGGCCIPPGLQAGASAHLQVNMSQEPCTNYPSGLHLM